MKQRYISRAMLSPLSTHSIGPFSVSHYRLKNGLDILLFPDPKVQIFAMHTWFRVGSRHEQPGITGIAHLFEHLMFNQTKHTQPGEFDELIEHAGGHTNAATWVDWTYYQNNLPSSELDMILKLEAQRMIDLTLTESQLISEKEVVLNERRFRVDDDVDGFMSEQLFKLAFEKHPYHWPTIGWVDDIKGISTENAHHFYRTYYAPNNATLILVGGFDSADALQRIETYYSHIPSQTIPLSNHFCEDPQTALRELSFFKITPCEKILIGYKIPAFSHPHHLALHILADLLSGGPSSRLHRRLVVEEELLASLHCYPTPFQEPGLFEFAFSVRADRSIQRTMEVFQEEINNLILHGIEEEELSRCQARFLTHFYAGLRSVHGKAEALGEYHTIAGDYRLLFELPQAIQQLEKSHIDEVIKTYLREEACSRIFVYPNQP